VGIQDLLVDGMTGLLSAPNDAVELGRSLVRLYQDSPLAARMVEAGWQYVSTHGRLQTMVERYELLYERLAARAH
jgi:hypothetical protein